MPRIKTSLTVLPRNPRQNKSVRPPRVSAPSADAMSKQGARAAMGQKASTPRGVSNSSQQPTRSTKVKAGKVATPRKPTMKGAGASTKGSGGKRTTPGTGATPRSMKPSKVAPNTLSRKNLNPLNRMGIGPVPVAPIKPGVQPFQIGPKKVTPGIVGPSGITGP